MFTNAAGSAITNAALLNLTPSLPIVLAKSSTKVTASEATLNGRVDCVSLNPNVEVSFEYGLDTSYGNTVAAVPPTLHDVGVFNASLTGLNANTLYHYRAKATVPLGTVYGPDSSFITCSTAQQASALIQANSNNSKFSIIDVRTPEEFVTGFIEGAVNIDYYASDFRTSQLWVLDKGKTYLVYCGSGKRSALARDIMADMGFQTVYTIVDGLTTWKSLGYPLVVRLGITTASLPKGQIGVAYNQTLAAGAGKTPYTWSIASGTLPAGLALNATTGAISGTPTAVGGPVNLTFLVTDNAGAKATRVLALTIEKSATTTIITSSANPSTPGQSVVFAAKVTGSCGYTDRHNTVYHRRNSLWQRGNPG